ncbi:hypothetical protein BD779DRAFT_1680743 [Infundibulicybe gibba]|nr:hypothetical protein BD779DRAFT_1680743 [Infundibulicybe gibba]
MLDKLRFIAGSALGRLRRRLLPLARCAVSDLPPEILGEIFLHCLPPGEWGSFSARDAPLLLIKVCCSWREVALSTPSLWSRLPPLPAYPEDDHFQLLKLYLNKSAKRALSIAFVPRGPPADVPVLSLITPYLSQSQHLGIWYHHGGPSREPSITHDHFPLLKSLELSLAIAMDPVLEGQVMIEGLEGMKFPWAQLTQLTIELQHTVEILTLLRNCSSLEALRLNNTWGFLFETPPPLPALRTVHHRLRTIVFEGFPIMDTDLLTGLLSCLVTPALSTLEFIQTCVPLTEHHTMELILSFIRNSSAELTSLTLNGTRCSLRDLVDLSALIPMVTELDLFGIDLDSLQLLTVKSNSPHGILFPCLERLIIREPADLSFDLNLSYYSDMFHSRLYLAPNTTIIENMSPLQHAELHLQLSAISCGMHDFGQQSCWNESDFGILIQRLQMVYSETVGFNRETDHRFPRVISYINRQVFPARHKLGYCAGRWPTRQTIRFFRKLDAAFAALEGYHITHALEILVCIIQQ